jgi:hypothetical protein
MDIFGITVPMAEFPIAGGTEEDDLGKSLTKTTIPLSLSPRFPERRIG